MTSVDLIKILENKNLFDEPFYDISQYPTYILSNLPPNTLRYAYM